MLITFTKIDRKIKVIFEENLFYKHYFCFFVYDSKKKKEFLEIKDYCINRCIFGLEY